MARTNKNSILKFENSLREFLINCMTDKYGSAKSYAYRYNNLKVYMDPRSVTDPHFFVSVGISEACFAISDGKKLEGGLGPEDGYVKRWSDKTNINKELLNHWNALKEAIAAEDEEEDLIKNTGAAIRLRRLETDAEKLDVDMTGTGIDKTKKESFQYKESRFKKLREDTDEGGKE